MSETYRHELKYTVDWGTYCSLRQRLKTVLKPDSHAGPNGCYHIHSIYFDNPDDKALREKNQRGGAAGKVACPVV